MESRAVRGAGAAVAAAAAFAPWGCVLFGDEGADRASKLGAADSGSAGAGGAEGGVSPWPDDPLDVSCWPGSKTACVSTVDTCNAGVRYCTKNEKGENRWGACVPAKTAPEVCGDGVDNDCNGKVDDGCGGAGGAGCKPGDPVPCTTSCGTKGTASCGADGKPGPCVPPKELCGNKIDDDCNGQTDDGCGTTHDCGNETGYGNCNTDPGYGDACSAADNKKGCKQDWFDAWCRRREEPSGGANWDAAVKKWVTDRCDGDVKSSGSTYKCVDGKGDVWQCTTPIVLVFDGAPVRLDAAGSGGFDLDARGACRAWDWPGPETPWLAMDRDGNGRIDDGAELFGSATPLGRGGRARDGFVALRDLDSDGDGWLTPADADWTRLRLWTDRDGDRASSPAEVEPLEARGIVAIALDAVRAPRCAAGGSCEVERAVFLWKDAGGGLRRGAAVDVHLRSR